MPWLVLDSLLLFPGCYEADTMQSSLVPALTPIMPPTFGGYADFAVEDSTAVYLGEPRVVEEFEENDLWIPRNQLDVQLGVRIEKSTRFRIAYREALEHNAMAVRPSSLGGTIGFPGQNARLFTGGFAYTFKRPDRPAGGYVGTDIGGLVAPVYLSTGEVVRNGAGFFSFYAAATYDVEDILRLYAMGHIQTHPLHKRSGGGTIEEEGDVRTGPLNAIIGVGLEITPVRWLAIEGRVHWPLGRRPIQYWPIVGAGIRITFGSAEDEERVDLQQGWPQQQGPQMQPAPGPAPAPVQPAPSPGTPVQPGQPQPPPEYYVPMPPG